MNLKELISQSHILYHPELQKIHLSINASIISQQHLLVKYGSRSSVQGCGERLPRITANSVLTSPGTLARLRKHLHARNPPGRWICMYKKKVAQNLLRP